MPQSRHWLARCLVVLIISGGLAAAGLPQGADANAAVRGTVVDAESKAPVGVGDVILVGTTHQTTNDAEVYFALTAVLAGAYTLEVTRVGTNTSSGRAS